MGVVKWLGRAWSRSLRKPRADFLEILPKQSVGCELGVFKGLFTREILRVVEPTKLHLVDPYWTIYGEHFDWASPHTEQGTLKTKDAHDSARAIIAEHDTKGVCELHVQDDVVFLEGVEDDYFDWAYVDSSHMYEHTRHELVLLDRKVKRDGLITGHDWRPDPSHRDHGVYLAVTEFCDSNGWEIVAIDRWNQWCIRREGSDTPVPARGRGFKSTPS